MRVCVCICTVRLNNLTKLCFHLHTGKYFSQCKTHTVEFDECIKNAINNVRPYFTAGIFFSYHNFHYYCFYVDIYLFNVSHV